MKPVQVLIKIRQGRKACTLVTGFEPYFINAEDLAEELRKICASSTSGSYYFYIFYVLTLLLMLMVQSHLCKARRRIWK